MNCRLVEGSTFLDNSNSSSRLPFWSIRYLGLHSILLIIFFCSVSLTPSLARSDDSQSNLSDSSLFSSERGISLNDLQQQYGREIGHFQGKVDRAGASVPAVATTKQQTFKSFPVPGMTDNRQFHATCESQSFSAPEATTGNMLFQTPPATYAFSGGAGYGANSALTPPTPAQGPAFQFDPATVTTLVNTLPSGVTSAVQADLLSSALPGMRLTDTGTKLVLSDFTQSLADRAQSPARWVYTAQASMQAGQQLASTSASAVTAMSMRVNMTEISKPLINVASEGASGSLGEIVSKVQTVFRLFFLPLALLLLLPGALLSVTKSTILAGFLADSDQDSVISFPPLKKAMIAIFLIPATQVIVSFSIDIGNSLTSCVQQATNIGNVTAWIEEQIPKPPSSGLLGGGLGGLAQKAVATYGASNPYVQAGQMLLKQTNSRPAADQTTGLLASTLQMLISNGLTVLLGFQLVMMLYLYCMGPIAAAFFAWPTGIGNLFTGVFGNWLNALINLALWRFWWSVIILIMDARYSWLKEQGLYQAKSPWEVAALTSFMVLLVSAPFIAFQFKPGRYVDQLMSMKEKFKV